MGERRFMLRILMKSRELDEVAVSFPYIVTIRPVVLDISEVNFVGGC